MKNQKVFVLAITGLLISVFLLNQFFFVNKPIKSLSNDNSLPYHVFEMPFEFANPESHTGLACLSMIFHYYGYDVEQSEIANISGTNIRGAGTPLDGFIDALNYDNYTNKDHGFQATVNTLENYTSEERWDFLKNYADSEIPLILGTRYSESDVYYIHYRIFIGYDERINSLYFNDPYDRIGDSSGPLSDFDFQQFELRWRNVDYLVIEVKPIELTLNIEVNENYLNLSCDIDTNKLDSIPADLSVSLSVPDYYNILSGELETTINEVKKRQSIFWFLDNQDMSQQYGNISVYVCYRKGNYTFGNHRVLYPFEPEKPTLSMPSPHIKLSNHFVPTTFDVVGTIETENVYSYEVFLESYNVSYIPSYKFTSRVIGTDIHEFKGSLGPFNVDKTIVFCWISVNTSFNKTYHSPISVFIINTSLLSNDYKISDSVNSSRF